MASYNVLRAFSWQLRLSPFVLEDWCAALVAPHPTPLLDEAHVAMLRLLAQDESRVRSLRVPCHCIMRWLELAANVGRRSPEMGCPARVLELPSPMHGAQTTDSPFQGNIVQLCSLNHVCSTTGDAGGAGAGLGAAGRRHLARLRLGVAAIHGYIAAPPPPPHPHSPTPSMDM